MAALPNVACHFLLIYPALNALALKVFCHFNNPCVIISPTFILSPVMTHKYIFGLVDNFFNLITCHDALSVLVAGKKFVCSLFTICFGYSILEFSFPIILNKTCA